MLTSPFLQRTTSGNGKYRSAGVPHPNADSVSRYSQTAPMQHTRKTLLLGDVEANRFASGGGHEKCRECGRGTVAAHGEVLDASAAACTGFTPGTW